MKNHLQYMSAVVILLTVFLCSGRATTNVQLVVDSNTNVALVWPSETNQVFIIGHRSTLSQTNPWVLLTNIPATTNSTQTGFIHLGAIASNNSGFYVVGEFSEDSDNDGLSNGQEVLLDTDPFTFDDNGDVGYPFAPSVYSGEVVINYDANSGAANNLGPFLYANSDVANTLTTTEPVTGELHLKWSTAVVDHFSSFVFLDSLDTPPSFNFTGDEAKMLHGAFGQGTSITKSIISVPDQAKVDQLPIELLQRYEEFAIAQMDYNFKFIQAVNAGTKAVPDVSASTRANLASIHTQWTREQAISRSLKSRIGRTIGKVLPLLGGVFIIANSAANAQDFIDAAQAYSNDILTGDDETGDAAIFAGVCNNIAPGSSDIVLGYLLR